VRAHRANCRAHYETVLMLHGDWAEAALDVAYFIGCAMWTALTALLMNEPGCHR